MTNTTPRSIHVLGIETSCDDTGIAIVRQDGHILSNCIHSQLVQHLNNGGIIPMVAKDYHVENIDRVARQAMAESGLGSVAKDIDAIAVTTRPGLESSLQVGLNYARQLARKYCKPLIPIHHMQAHALMPLLQNRLVKFPFMALLLSGGHCLIAICERYNKFHILGQSRDDAPGDLLDKVARRARLRNLGPPFDRISGGAAIELLAKRENSNRFKYFDAQRSIPMLSSRGCNFSFSGYRGNFEKLAPVIDELWMCGDRDKLLDELGHLSGSLQRAILAQVFRKLHRAMAYYRMYWRYDNPQAFQTTNSTCASHLGYAIRTDDVIDNEYLDVVVSGGVAANSYLLDQLRSCCSTDIDSSEPMNVYAPPKNLCNDNGLMIAWNGMLRYMDLMRGNSSSNTIESDRTAKELNDSIVYDPQRMDLIESQPVSPMGRDISELVTSASFKMARVKNQELKVR